MVTRLQIKQSGNKRWLKVTADDPAELTALARRTGVEIKPGTSMMSPHCDLSPKLVVLPKETNDSSFSQP